MVKNEDPSVFWNCPFTVQLEQNNILCTNTHCNVLGQELACTKIKPVECIGLFKTTLFFIVGASYHFFGEVVPMHSVTPHETKPA